MIDTIEGLLNFIETEEDKGYKVLGSMKTSNVIQPKLIRHNGEDDFFCTFCNDKRKGYVTLKTSLKNPTINCINENLPMMFQATCYQCNHKTAFILFLKNDELDLVTLSDYYSGVGTENTPTPIKYYLDQAFRAKTAGAISAAAAMYRSALEWILYDQGYKEGMLGNKIKELEKDINNDKGPLWSKHINIEFLQAIKDIGNGSMHTNDGDLEIQKNIDESLLNVIDIVMTVLLNKIYEEPIKNKTNLELLKQRSSIFNKK